MIETRDEVALLLVTDSNLTGTAQVHTPRLIHSKSVSRWLPYDWRYGAI